MLKSKKFLFVTALCLAIVFLAVGCGGGSAPANKEAEKAPEKYPAKPVELVVPFGPGGSHDLHSRAIVSVISQHLGGPMTVTLKAGGSGAVGSDYVAKAKPDGYTLLFGGSGPNTSLLHVRELPYKREDFTPIAKINHSPGVIVVPADSPFKTLEDLIKYAKENPGELRYSSSGPYGATHIPTEMLKAAAGVDIVHVPFDGGGPALMAMLGKQVDFTATMTTQTRPIVDAGKARALGISGAERDKGSLKDVPTFKELGYDAVYEMGRFVLAPKDTPEPVVTQLREAFKNLMEDKTFQRLISNMGEEIFYLDGPELQKWWDAEYAAQEKVIKDLVAAEKK